MNTVILEVLKPVAAEQAKLFKPASRLPDLSGAKIGLFWNSKIGGEVALDEITQRLIQVLEFCRVGAFAKAVAQITIKA